MTPQSTKCQEVKKNQITKHYKGQFLYVAVLLLEFKHDL
jgi:hypothetical protein